MIKFHYLSTYYVNRSLVSVDNVLSVSISCKTLKSAETPKIYSYSAASITRRCMILCDSISITHWLAYWEVLLLHSAIQDNE